MALNGYGRKHLLLPWFIKHTAKHVVNMKSAVVDLKEASGLDIPLYIFQR